MSSPICWSQRWYIRLLCMCLPYTDLYIIILNAVVCPCDHKLLQQTEDSCDHFHFRRTTQFPLSDCPLRITNFKDVQALKVDLWNKSRCDHECLIDSQMRDPSFVNFVGFYTKDLEAHSIEIPWKSISTNFLDISIDIPINLHIAGDEMTW